jgi:hypothetical protein
MPRGVEIAKEFNVLKHILPIVEFPIDDISSLPCLNSSGLPSSTSTSASKVVKKEKEKEKEKDKEREKEKDVVTGLKRSLRVRDKERGEGDSTSTTAASSPVQSPLKKLKFSTSSYANSTSASSSSSISVEGVRKSSRVSSSGSGLGLSAGLAAVAENKPEYMAIEIPLKKTRVGPKKFHHRSRQARELLESNQLLAKESEDVSQDNNREALEEDNMDESGVEPHEEEMAEEGDLIKTQDEWKAHLMTLFLSPTPWTIPDSYTLPRLASSVDLNAALDAHGSSPAHYAACLSNLALLKLLLQRSGPQPPLNDQGQTPLARALSAVEPYRTAMFPGMLDAMRDWVGLRDGADRTVLHAVAMSAGIRGLGGAARYYAEILVEHIGNEGLAIFVSGGDEVEGIGLDRFVNARDRNGDTAVCIAARTGDLVVLELLLGLGADPTVKNESGLDVFSFGVDPDWVWMMVMHFDCFMIYLSELFSFRLVRADVDLQQAAILSHKGFWSLLEA